MVTGRCKASTSCTIIPTYRFDVNVGLLFRNPNPRTIEFTPMLFLCLLTTRGKKSAICRITQHTYLDPKQAASNQHLDTVRLISNTLGRQRGPSTLNIFYKFNSTRITLVHIPAEAVIKRKLHTSKSHQQRQ